MMADEENRANWSRPELHHWAEREWRKFVTPDNAEDLKHWVPGSDLPEVHLTNHLSPPHIRFAQRLTHAFLLPVLDRLRPDWPEDARPQPIPENVVTMLEEELKQ
jgi:hypothetical protein